MMKELTVDALTDNLDTVIQFIEEQLEEANCSPKILMQINLAADTISTTAGDAAPDPLAGVSVTTSSGETITDVSTSVTYTITDAGGNTVDAASAAAAAGTYTITYSYTDTIYGTITKTASWTVASVEQTVPSESETSAEAVPEST